MLDIIPSGSPSRSGSRRGALSSRRRRRLVSSSQESVTETGKPPVVELEWRLPARLRRPVRQELDRQRRRAQRRRAIVQFERRPLHTELPPLPQQYRGARAANRETRGAEYHTGDVYMHSQPSVRFTLPPYSGRFVAGRTTKTARPQTRQRPVRAQKRVPVSPPREVAVKPARQSRPRVQTPVPTPRQSPPAPRRVPVQTSLPVQMVERDVPFDWQKVERPQATPEPVQSTEARRVTRELPTTSTVQVVPQAPAKIQEPRRRFALPLHFSIFPRSQEAGTSEPAVMADISSKKKLQ